MVGLTKDSDLVCLSDGKHRNLVSSIIFNRGLLFFLCFPYNYATPCKHSNGGIILFLDNSREVEFSNSLIKMGLEN